MKMNPKIACLAIALLLTLPTLGWGQLSKTGLLKQEILDAEAVQQAAQHLPLLSAEQKLLDAQLKEMSALLGYRRDMLPVTFAQPSPAVLAKAQTAADALTKLRAACAIKAKSNEKLIKPAERVAYYTVTATHPGGYYYGYSEDLLCEHPLAGQMQTLELQDYPFEEAAESDECLWNLPDHAPHLQQLVAFACEIDDELLGEMRIADLKELVVLELSENMLTSFPASLLATGSLRVLSLPKNDIVQLPADLSAFGALLYIDLRGNPIAATERARITKALPHTTVVFE